MRGTFTHRHALNRGTFVTGLGIGYPFGFGYGLGGYGYGGYPGFGATTVSTIAPTSAQGAGIDYAALGDQAFKADRYDDAIHNWQHALLDDPQNAGLVMLLGQAYFARQNYDAAAGAVQQAMQMLPADKWGVVVENYPELYSGNQAYTDQLRALENARNQKPDSPALRFLLGYHYGYLGYPQQAVRELDHVVKLNPQDKTASQLRDLMRSRLSPAGTAAPASPSA
jgi:tetratricopeptide (TPR) repeat protein